MLAVQQYVGDAVLVLCLFHIPQTSLSLVALPNKMQIGVIIILLEEGLNIETMMLSPYNR